MTGALGGRWIGAGIVAGLVAGSATWGAGAGAQDRGATRWVTAWSTSQQALGDAPLTNATVRLTARVTLAGDAIRIRLDNTFGREPLTIGRAFVGHRVRGALIATGSNRPITFDGSPQVSIAPGASILSDPVALPVLAQQDLAVSLFVPGQRVQPSQHTNAVVTSWRSPDGSGDVAAGESATPFTATTTSTWWLKAIEVQAGESTGAVVAFGDSITDGTCSTLDAHDRWEDLLSLRLGLEHDAAVRSGASRMDGPRAVLNEGIGGNTLTREGLNPPPDSPTALERFERDVASHHGVDTVVLFMGTNDIRRGAGARQVIEAMTTIAQRARAAKLRAIGVTIIPRHSQPATSATPWDDSRTRIRNEVNAWLRSGRAPFDAVIDFDRVVRDPADADRIRPAFDCGDGIHPSPRGYFEMGVVARPVDTEKALSTTADQAAGACERGRLCLAPPQCATASGIQGRSRRMVRTSRWSRR
jgi:lysophospholipase L1-like esterase